MFKEVEKFSPPFLLLNLEKNGNKKSIVMSNNTFILRFQLVS